MATPPDASSPHHQARRALIARRGALLEAKRNNEADREALREGDEGSRDRVDTQTLSGMLVALAERERNEVKDLEAALGRIDAGTYGACERCGASIGGPRLLAVPAARWCLTCSQARVTDGAADAEPAAPVHRPAPRARRARKRR